MYNIPVINYDIQTSETLNDVLFSLQQLSKTIDQVYNRIEERVIHEKSRLANVNNRISLCQNKVNQIKGCNNAITIFSTTKFPAPVVPTRYPALLNEANTIESFNPPDDSKHYTLADPKLSALSNPRLNDELEVMLTRLVSSGNNNNNITGTIGSKSHLNKKILKEVTGIGSRPPDSIRSTTSLLLFNSSIDPYKNYQPSDNLAKYGRSKEDSCYDDDMTSIKVLASAPTTLVNGSDSSFLPDIHALDLTFRPVMGQHNKLELPSNLPLDFVAENIRYKQTMQPSIAPSVQLQANYSLLQITDSDNSHNVQQYSSSTTGSSNSAFLLYSPNPTMKEETMRLMPNADIANTSQSTQQISQRLPPPPPPPPPPLVSHSLTVVSEQNSNFHSNESKESSILNHSSVGANQYSSSSSSNSSSSSSNSGSGNGNNIDIVTIIPSLSTINENNNNDGTSNTKPSFLDAIKAAGSTRLKPVTQKDSNDPTPSSSAMKSSSTNSSKPISMMEEIQAKMKRRNSVLSGQEDKIQQRRDSAIVQAAVLSQQQQQVQQRPLPPQLQHKKTTTRLSVSKMNADHGDGLLSLVSIGSEEYDNQSVFSDMSMMIPTRDHSQPIQQSSIQAIENNNNNRAAAQSMIPSHPQFFSTTTATITARRGSLLDSENVVLNSLLVLAKDKDRNNRKGSMMKKDDNESSDDDNNSNYESDDDDENWN